MTDKIFSHAYVWMCKHNQSDSNLYHNNKHILFVFQKSMELFDIYKKEYGLKSNDRINLGLAAIFHDFNHSGGKLKDNENIELSLKGLKEYLQEEDMMDRYEDITSIIEATEFPHKDTDLDILQMIIRDADTMGGISDSWFQIITAIAGEYGKSMSEFIPVQIGFLDTLKFNTPYCNKLLDERRDKIKKELLKLQSDLFSK